MRLVVRPDLFGAADIVKVVGLAAASDLGGGAGVPLSLSELGFFRVLAVWVVKLYAGGACRAFTGFYLRVCFRP